MAFELSDNDVLKYLIDFFLVAFQYALCIVLGGEFLFSQVLSAKFS